MRKTVSPLYTKVINLFNEHNPSTITEIRRLGIKAIKIGGGVFRNIYKIEKLPLVIKIPRLEADIPHSRAEYDAVQHCLNSRALKASYIRPYMPQIPYFNEETGILLMEYVQPLNQTKTPKAVKNSIVGILEDFIENVWPMSFDPTDNDIHSGNIGVNKYGQFKFIDLGYFLPDGRC